MIRIDIDDYVILYLQYEDSTHRYAVPSQWTVSLLANRLVDSFDKNKPVSERRKPNSEYQVFDHNGQEYPMNAVVGGFVDGVALLVKVKEE